jgi:hypothetical protein
MRKVARIILIGLVVIAIVLFVWWRLPGRVVDYETLDGVKAYDDPASRSLIIVASFEAFSIAVLDSCSHRQQGGDPLIELRSKLLIARDGRTLRIGVFRLPYTGAAPSAVLMQGRDGQVTIPVESPPPATAGAWWGTPVESRKLD